MKYKAFQVEVTRGHQVESQHQVVAVLWDQTTQKIETIGDPNTLVYPRSALKPIQALPLILTGAADHFKVTDQELALACASHHAESIHIEIVQNWLHRLQMSEESLECGAHAPTNLLSLADLHRRQVKPTSIHNNCSGKHTGMLTTALFLSEPLKNYSTKNHPVQKRISAIIEKLCRISISEEFYGIDGCSIPSPCLPISHLAQGYGEFAHPLYLSDTEAAACHRLFQIFVKNPLLTTGSEHYCARIMSETKGRLLVKGGAEGVMIAAIPELRLGLALKALDGQARAVEFCTSILLHRLGLLDKESAFLHPKIYNWNLKETGVLRLKQPNNYTNFI